MILLLLLHWNQNAPPESLGPVCYVLPRHNERQSGPERVFSLNTQGRQRKGGIRESEVIWLWSDHASVAGSVLTSTSLNSEPEVLTNEMLIYDQFDNV